MRSASTSKKSASRPRRTRKWVSSAARKELRRWQLLPLICKMPKAEISWKRVTDEGVKLQVYVQRIGRDWKFFQREKRYDVWQPVPEPPLEDWMELLDAVQRLINRRRYQ